MVGGAPERTDLGGDGLRDCNLFTGITNCQDLFVISNTKLITINPGLRFTPHSFYASRTFTEKVDFDIFAAHAHCTLHLAY